MEAIDSLLLQLKTEFGGFDTPQVWLQVALLVVAALVAFAVHRWLGGRFSGDAAGEGLRRLTRRSLQRLAFPLVLLLVALLGRAILDALKMPTALLNVAVPLMLSLAAVRIVVYMLRKGFAPSPTLKAWESVIAFSIWAVVALHLLNWLDPVRKALDALGFQVGSVRITALAVINVVLLLAFLFTGALWLANLIEQRLAHAQNMSPTMRVGVSKFAKFILVAVAALLTVEAAGIDLTAFAVFGGAVGVGLGFGLQRIASNFISGFILIFDRSIRPGDIITVGDTFGWVLELRARYLVVRNRDGVESLIPNETFISNEVINWSYSDRNVRVRCPVQVSYSDDPEQAMALMLEAARDCPRVLTDPPPVTRLMEFGDNGISLELRVWINDPMNGVANVRSDVNLGIWRRFKEAGITIPFPQRDVHLVGKG